MKLRMTIEVELREDILLPTDVEMFPSFEDALLRPESGELTLHHPDLVKPLGIVTKVLNTDYIEHEIKP